MKITYYLLTLVHLLSICTSCRNVGTCVCNIERVIVPLDSSCIVNIELDPKSECKIFESRKEHDLLIKCSEMQSVDTFETAYCKNGLQIHYKTCNITNGDCPQGS
jgi:hypothetical protein